MRDLRLELESFYFPGIQPSLIAFLFRRQRRALGIGDVYQPILFFGSTMKRWPAIASHGIPQSEQADGVLLSVEPEYAGIVGSELAEIDQEDPVLLAIRTDPDHWPVKVGEELWTALRQVQKHPTATSFQVISHFFGTKHLATLDSLLERTVKTPAQDQRRELESLLISDNLFRLSIALRGDVRVVRSIEVSDLVGVWRLTPGRASRLALPHEASLPVEEIPFQFEVTALRLGGGFPGFA